jgi:hypothetical protein
MSVDPHILAFPQRIPEKLKTIRERLRLTPDEIAPKVGARTGAEIQGYENDEVDLLVSVLWKYAKLAGCPIDHILDDNLEVTTLEFEQPGSMKYEAKIGK